MRKYNSSFKTAFISEAGNRLKNNDYFGFVELDQYACYVIADGITDMREAASAKAAIEAVIEAFQRAPGIGRGKLKSCLRFANNELLKGVSYEKMKASITVVVTNYEKFRYGHAGNTRLRLYRDGRNILATSDTSLSQDLVEEERLTEDKIARHEERNNLFSYLGQEWFHPFISKKIKLLSGDIITLYTRGIWENVDEGELADVFAEAGNEPAQECDKVEDLLLSRQPVDLDNYTFAAIYIDKVFADPQRKKRLKKMITVSAMVILAAAVIAFIIFLWRRDRRLKREEMERYFSNTETYIEDCNFIRAKEECEKALELARKLKDQELADRYNAYLICMEALISADDCYAEGNYTEARDAYLIAEARVRYADNTSLDYIEKKLLQLSAYEQVFDYIELGDSLFEHDNYELAEGRYLEAKKQAASIYFDEGKKQALDALEKLYEEWSAVKEEEEKKKKEQEELNAQQAAEQAAQELSAAELVRQGDEAYAQGDYDGALVFYLIALEKYSALEDTVQIELLNKKIQALKEKQEEVAARMAEAKALEELARALEEQKDYAQAKIQYQYAKAVYTELGKDNKADEIQGKIDILDGKETQAEKEKEEQEKEEKEKEEKEKEEQEKREKEEKEKEEKEKEKEEIVIEEWRDSYN